MSAPHLLSLSALHAAAPGVLSVVFGSDGDFEGAPLWLGPVRVSGGRSRYLVAPYVGAEADWRPLDRNGALVAITGLMGKRYPLESLALDCRVPSVAARLAGLCNRAMLLGDMDIDNQTAETFARAMRGTARGWAWSVDHASRLASLTLSLAPRIAALRSPA